MDDFVVNVKQIGNYPAIDHVGTGDLVLVQQGGLGGPYKSATQDAFLSLTRKLGVGILPAPDANGVISSFLITPLGRRQGYNFYVDGNGTMRSLQGGPVGQWDFDGGTLSFAINAASSKDAPISQNLWQTAFSISSDGMLDLFQQVRVGRDPASANELTTMRWVEQFVTCIKAFTFNGRGGHVVLNVQDLNDALMLAPGNAIADQCWVSNAIECWYFNQFLTPGAAPNATTPPPGDDSTRIATSNFVNVAIAAADVAVMAQVQGLLTGYAPITSPHLIGNPTAPTAVPGTSTGQIATTAFVQAAITGSVVGVSSFNTRTGPITLTLQDVTDTGVLNNTVLTGISYATTMDLSANDGEIATTSFVHNAIIAHGIGVTTFNGRNGDITFTSGDLSSVGGATTAYVDSAITQAGGVNSFNGRSGIVNLIAADVSAAGGALIASPTFTGAPLAPTAALGTNTTQLATTAFVAAAIAALTGTGVVTTFNTRNGAVTLLAADLTGAGGALLAGPAFTGTPTAPTAAQGNNSTRIATTAYVDAFVPSNIPSTNITATGVDFSVSITLSAADDGALKICMASTAVTVTCPNNLPNKFYCTFIQGGVGLITFVPGAGATLNNRQNMIRSAGQYAMCALAVQSNAGTNAAYVLGGDVGA